MDDLPPNKPSDPVRLTVTLEPGTTAQVVVQARSPQGEWMDEHTFRLGQPSRPPLAALLMGAALAVYLITRLVGLQQFPIYFFTDEAAQTVLAMDFVRDHFHNYAGEFLPAFFENGGQYNLGLSVYLQIVPYLMFGRAVWVTRGVCALFTLLAALALARTLQTSFGSRTPWTAVLVLAATPAWFLHSRTAFETMLAATLYAVFLYCYLCYRQGAHRALYAAVLCAALTAYSYSPAQVVIASTGLLLLISDGRYHWQQRRVVLRAAGLGLLLAVPYLRFLIAHGQANQEHLRLLGSYWLSNLSMGDKLAEYVRLYALCLDPAYWFSPAPAEMMRHVMSGYGNLLRPALPFTLLGLGLAVSRIRQPAYRALLITLLCAPTGAALVGPGITRLMTLIIPATLFTALGIEAGLRWAGHWRWGRLLPALTFVALSAGSFHLLGDALLNGPRWYNQYGMNGMQYGAQQVFAAARDYQQKHPQTHIVLSPSWANGTDVLARFFLGDPPPETPPEQIIQLGSILGWADEQLPLDDNTLFILPPEEYEFARSSNKFTGLRVEQTLPYPNGQPGFYFVRLRYVPQIGAILADEHQQARQPQTATLWIHDAEADVSYSPLDMGLVEELFDGDLQTVTRTQEANPYLVHIEFRQPQRMSGLNLQIGGVPTRVEVTLLPVGQSQARRWQQTAPGTPDPRRLQVDFGGEFDVLTLEIKVYNSEDNERAHVHLWEIEFQP